MKHIIQEVNNIRVLLVGEMPSMCPFRTQQPVQDNFQRMQFIGQPCDSRCPHWHEKNIGNNMSELTLTCGNIEQPIIAENHVPNNSGNSGKLKLHV
jgi:hypothetical protein